GRASRTASAERAFPLAGGSAQYRDPDLAGPRRSGGASGGSAGAAVQDPGGVGDVRNPAPDPARIFLLSPARCEGVRMTMVRRPAAQFPLAVELRSLTGAMLGDVFTFTSGLYFRGKLTYARSFGPSWVITPGAGLVEPERRIRPRDLDAWAKV